MAKRIHILVGTVFGQAEQLAKQASRVLSQSGFRCHINTAPQCRELAAHKDDILLICTANTGKGELPASLHKLSAEIALQGPVLTGTHYGLINLGDSNYPHFAQAGEKICHALDNAGARLTGTPLVLDSSSGQAFGGQLKHWLEQWQHQLHTLDTEL